MAATSFLGRLDERDRKHLTSCARTEKVRCGAVVFRKGDPAQSLLILISGTIKVSAAASDGREFTLSIIGAGEILGEIALFDGEPLMADAIAMSDCELLAIDRRDFIPFVEERPAVALKLIALLCKRLRHTSELVEDVAFRAGHRRLAKALLKLHSDTPATDGQGRDLATTARIVRITQRELGGLVCIARETTNKQLMAWQRAGIVAVMRGGIQVLDPDRLGQLADEA
jgi:CRP/FNR family transcriptional regulator, cyclic AMP receptor protein